MDQTSSALELQIKHKVCDLLLLSGEQKSVESIFIPKWQKAQLVSEPGKRLGSIRPISCLDSGRSTF